MVELHDTLTLDSKARRLSTGELVATVRCARTGVQDYAGPEVGKPELDRVTVYRPEAEVMKRDSLASFAGVPVTIDHPGEAMTTDNWKQFAVGETGEDVLRDGQFIRVPMIVRDEAAIRAIQDGKRQISMGYSCSLEFVDGVTDAGEPYQAIQRNLKINHLAIVDNARGGPSLTVADERPDGQTYSHAANANKNATTKNGDGRMPHTLIIDGLQVTEVSDQAKAAIEKLQGQVKAAEEARATADVKVGELTATVSTKDGEIAALNQKVADAEVTPAQLEQLVADRSALIAQAKAIDPNLVTDGKTEGDIRKAVVLAKLGDAAKDFDDAAIGGAFAVLAKDVKTDPIRNAMSGAAPQNLGDAKAEYERARDLAKKQLSDGWKTPAAIAA
jgi:hypothetical protein